MTPPAMTPEQISEAALLYTDHEWTAVDIAEHFDLDPRVVRRALVNAGVALRPQSAAPVLRIKQCTRCLHFLPVGLFSWSGTADKRRLQSQCIDCTNQRESDRWTVDVQPLAAALGNWRMQ